MRKFLATTAAGLALATGSIAMATLSPIGMAGAQEGTPTEPSATNQPAEGQRPGSRHVRQIARAGVKSAAETIGIEPQALVTAMRGGQSIAEVATANGVNPQTVIDKLVADASARIDTAVTNGKLSAEKAAEIKNKLPERITQIVNRHFDGSHRRGAATPAS